MNIFNFVCVLLACSSFSAAPIHVDECGWDARDESTPRLELASIARDHIRDRYQRDVA